MLKLISSLLVILHWPVAFYVLGMIILFLTQFLTSEQYSLLPEQFRKAFAALLQFGKTTDKKNATWLASLTVPKRWFGHFYILSSIEGVLCCLILFKVFVLEESAPNIFIEFLDVLTVPSRRPKTTNLSGLVCVSLLTLQCLARLYECYRVHVFSKDAIMNWMHYFVGIGHYFCAFTTLMYNMPVFARDDPSSVLVPPKEGELVTIAATAIVFITAWTVQRDTMRRLAAFRNTKGGSKVQQPQRYVLPTGGAFEYVSCPHMTAEVLMYLSLYMLQNSWSWMCAVAFVSANQFEVALSTHQWYKEKFKHYPQERSAIVPWVI